jgi:surface protein
MKTITNLTILLLLMLAVKISTAQVKVGNDANPSAVLEVDSHDAGILIPRLTDAQRDAIKSPAEGLMVFNTTSESLNYWDGTAWKTLSATFVTTNTGSTAITGGVAINSTGDPAAPSAMLDVQSTEKGLLLPRTTHTAIGTAAAGLLIYSTVSKAPIFYSGIQWEAPCQGQVSTASASGTANGEGVLIGDAIGSPDASAMLEVSGIGKGLLLPRLSDEERNLINPVIGLMIYNNTNMAMQYYTSGGWHQISAIPQPSAIAASEESPWQYSEGVTYSVIPEDQTTYTWTVPDGWIITSGQGTNQITVNLGANDGIVQVVPSGECGNGISRSLEVYTKKGFITTWNTENVYGNSPINNLLRIPMIGDGYDYHVNWGDGSSDDYNTNPGAGIRHYLSKTYDSPGTYTVTITGDFPRIYLYQSYEDYYKLIEINQWGEIAWTSMEGAFSNCQNMIGNFSDAPDLSLVGSLSNMFSGCRLFNSPIDYWDVSMITDVSQMFQSAVIFNQPLNNWDVSSVTNMSSIFSSASNFNQALNNWDLSSVTNMYRVFYAAVSFNQSINDWDVSSVTNMNGLFYLASGFDQPLYNWDVSSVTDMNEMFYNASSFNQSLIDWCVPNIGVKPNGFDDLAANWSLPRPIWGFCPGSFITSWNTSKPGASQPNQISIPLFGNGYDFTIDWGDGNQESFVLDPGNLAHSIEHTYDISGIYTVSISGEFPRIYFNNQGDRLKLIEIVQWGAGGLNWQSFENAFHGCENLISTATDFPYLGSTYSISYAFAGCSLFNGNISKWNVSAITDMSYAFAGASAFNKSLYNWDVSSAVNMEGMFQNAESFNQDLMFWETANATQMDYMFAGATSFNSDLSNWCVANIESEPLGFAQGAESWVLAKPSWGNCSDIFFTTIWNTTAILSGGTADNQISIPMYGNGYDFTIYWGDGSSQTHSANPGFTAHNLVHTYPEPGNYTVRISGDFPHFYLNSSLDRLKLIELKNWGNIVWSSMEDAFRGASAMYGTFTDSPDLSQVTNMELMFSGARVFNHPINDWDVSSVTNMTMMFSFAESFNQPLDQWDMSSVNSLIRMFYYAISFNSATGNWNLSSATDLSWMFWGATSFNQPIDGWIVSSVTVMDYLFNMARSFNQPLNSWDVSSVVSMSYMFANATAFNQPLDQWDVSSVYDMGSMFSNAQSFNQPLDQWDVTSVGNISYIFSNAISFNQPLNNWDLSSVTNMTGMFNNAISFDQPLHQWNVTAVTNMSSLFKGASSFNQPLGNWNTENVTFMSSMFQSAASFNQDLYGWCVAGLPSKPSNFDLDTPSGWTENKKPQWGSCPFENAFLTQWKTDNPGASASNQIRIPTVGTGYNFTVYWGDGSSDSYTETPASGYVEHTYSEAGMYFVAILGDFPQIFFNNEGDPQKIISVQNWGNISWSSFENAFYGCSNLNISASDVPRLEGVSSLSGMFRDCSSLNSPFLYWDVSGITQMDNMFNGATSFNQDLSSWCVSQISEEPAGFASGANAWVMEKPQWGGTCDYLVTYWDTELTGIGSSASNQIRLPMIGGGFDFIIHWGDGQSETYLNNPSSGTTHNLLHTYDAPGTYIVRIYGSIPRIYFNNTGDKLKLLDIIRWGSNEYFSMARAFYGCANLIISAADAPGLSLVTDMSYMFSEAKNFNQSILHWNTSNVINMSYMFNKATKYNQPLGLWNTSNVSNMSYMFNEATNFNQPIGDWNTANVSSMSHMFQFARNFNQDLSEWCVPNIFTEPTNFDQYTHVDWTDDKKPQWGTCIYGDAFVMQWNTAYPGASAANQIRIPTAGTGHNFTVYWGDGETDTYTETPVLGYVEHTYDEAGMYSVRIMGDFPQIYFNNQGDRQKITDIRNWGNITWSSFENAFYGCTNLNISADDLPVTSGATTMAGMFRDCSSLNAPIYSWDVSGITQMDNMFNGASSFNQDLSGWCVSQIVSEPIGFASGATAWILDKPVWGSSCDYFLTKWNTIYTSTGSSADNQISIPMRGGGYDFTVYWGDGQSENYVNNPSVSTNHNLVHTYDAPGNYMVRIVGSFPRIHFNDAGDKLKLLDILRWGSNEYANMANAFRGCANLRISATDAPGLTNVTDMSLMFSKATVFNQPIGHWNTSNVTNMRQLFYYAENFNQPIGDWDISNVTDISGMFSGATYFNKPIGNWNTSNVLFASSVFSRAANFNQPIGNWNTSSVWDMASMFNYAASFNQPIGQWNTSNVTKMSSMFNEATSFNQPIGEWNTANVTTMAYMFYSARAFNQPIGEWNTANVTNMDYMFRSASVFNQDIYGWCVQDIPVKPVDFDRFAPSAWTDIKKPQWGSCPFEYAFIMEWKTDNPGVSATDEIRIPTAGSGHNFTVYWGDGSSDSYTETPATGYVAHTYLEEGTYYVKILGDFPHIYFNNAGDRQKLLEIRNWGSIAWMSFENAFYGCTNLTISAADVPLTSEVTSMAAMFRDCSSLNAPLYSWDVSSIVQMDNMFNGATNFNQDLSGWCVSQIITEPIGFATGATAWDLPKPQWGMSCDFLLTHWNTTLTSSGSSANNQIRIPMRGGGYDFTVYWGDGQFENYISDPSPNTTHSLVHTYDLPGNYMVRIYGSIPRIYFNNGGDKLKLLEVLHWGPNEYASMGSAFYGCENLSIPAADAPDLSNVEDMSFMLAGASGFNQQIAHWNTSYVTNMNGMFNSATNFNKPLDDWNTTNVVTMNSMFLNATSFNQPIGNWNTSSVTNMNSMFWNAESFNQDLSGWCVTNITTMPSGFDFAANLWTLPNSRPVWGTCP